MDRNIILSKFQKEKLKRLHLSKSNSLVTIYPYEKKLGILAKRILRKIYLHIPSKRVKFMGSAALKIAGMKDLDFFVYYSDIKTREEYIRKFRNIFGLETRRTGRWDFYEENIKISIILADINDERRKKQIDFFNFLKNNKDILKKYEIIKCSLNGKKYKDYLITKMDFYSRVNIFSEAENQKRIKFLLKQGCILNNDHFFIKNSNYKGFHSKVSFTKNRLYNDKKILTFISKRIVNNFINDNIDVIIGVKTGGDKLTKLISSLLNGKHVRKTYPLCLEKSLKLSVLQKRIIKNKKILIVDDTLRTGNSLKILRQGILKAGGIIVGAGIICSRNILDNKELRIKRVYSFIIQDNKILSFSPKDCPMCKRGQILKKIF